MVFVISMLVVELLGWAQESAKRKTLDIVRSLLNIFQYVKPEVASSGSYITSPDTSQTLFVTGASQHLREGPTQGLDDIV